MWLRCLLEIHLEQKASTMCLMSHWQNVMFYNNTNQNIQLNTNPRFKKMLSHLLIAILTNTAAARGAVVSDVWLTIVLVNNNNNIENSHLYPIKNHQSCYTGPWLNCTNKICLGK